MGTPITTRGTGITKEEIHWHDPRTKEGTEGIRAMMGRLSVDPIQAIETWARSVLDGQDISERDHTDITDEFGFDSPEGYAARAIVKIYWMRLDIGAGRSHEAAKWGIELGALMREYQMKCLHEPNAMTGSKLRPQLKARRDSWNAKRRADAGSNHEKLRQERDKILANSPGMKPGKLARTVMARVKLPYSFDYVRKILRS